MTGCVAILAWATKEDASWQYVQQHARGATLGPASVTAAELSFPVVAQEKINSAECIHDARVRVEGQRMLLSLKHGLCPDGWRPPEVARLPRPAPGDYTVVYDDASAGFPVVGRLHVD